MKRLVSIIFAMMLFIGSAAPVTAYELAPSARMAGSAISDGILYICFGESTGEQIYVHRAHILDYVNATWGFRGHGNIEFRSNGLCNDSSAIRLRWNWSWSCPTDGTATLGQVQTYPWEWTHSDIYFNADCHYAGLFDYTSNGPNGNWGMSTDNNKYSFSELVAHEIGHALGIQHSSNTYSIMTSGWQTCGKGANQGLSFDDTQALKDEYDFQYGWTHGITNAPVVPICYG